VSGHDQLIRVVDGLDLAQALVGRARTRCSRVGRGLDEVVVVVVPAPRGFGVAAYALDPDDASRLWDLSLDLIRRARSA